LVTFLTKVFAYHKGLIKYNKANTITPMKTHINVTHAHLVAKRKLKVIVIVATKQFILQLQPQFLQVFIFGCLEVG
jgi:hypothetical protein